jgi:hypothetical protein
MFANIGRAWTMGHNSAGYNSADTSAGLISAVITLARDETQQKSFGLSLTHAWIRINDKDTRDDADVGNTGGTWGHWGPGIFYSPDAGQTTIAIATSRPVYFKTHSLQCAEERSIVMSMSTRF